MKMKSISLMNAYVASLLQDDKPLIWIFGYGSLMWHPGFKYETMTKGCLEGYSRKFYQGNTTYRGTDELPGRVVTLIESSENEETYGALFKVSGWATIFQCLEHLYLREIENGYSFRVVTVKDLHSDTTVLALTCVALQNNTFYLGPGESEECLAKQIAKAQGSGGPNRDYLIKLANAMRELFPGVDDDHLYTLEKLVLTLP